MKNTQKQSGLHRIDSKTSVGVAYCPQHSILLDDGEHHLILFIGRVFIEGQFQYTIKKYAAVTIYRFF